MRFLLFFICLTGLFAKPSLFLLEQAISKAYTRFYAKYPFKIQAIKVELASGNLSMLDQILKVASPQDLQWRTQQFLNKEGVLSLDQKIWIKYSLNASIGIYKSKTMLRKDQNLDASNTYSENIPFTHFNTLPIDASYINNSSARSFIAPHTILSIDRVGPKILIYKHEIFSATLKEGPLFLETSLQALENGVLNQVIQALNVRSKKVVQVKITGLLKGEVL
ncbi:flagellar basal body P-ring formation chaperone FlgA [Helicobacter suis]|uniref:flagellar basal body P-ring formation chaperone FlgA n=2 Tax=Helicobacter suis TaxID=104628 RepID=UPI0024911520|nr:flagellar basal body P-ring formation chaperone FlgA [Helicobacter suis]